MSKIKTPRSLEKLIKDFESSKGDFAKFHREMDTREKIMFKGWLTQMRSEIPRFSGQSSDFENIFETSEAE